jgi:hypothetical protein
MIMTLLIIFILYNNVVLFKVSYLLIVIVQLLSIALMVMIYIMIATHASNYYSRYFICNMYCSFH